MMTNYSIGQLVNYRQVTHKVPLSLSTMELPVHDEPRIGLGRIHAVWRVGTGYRIFVLPVEDAGKKDQITLLLRVPPDEVRIVGEQTKDCAKDRSILCDLSK